MTLLIRYKESLVFAPEYHSLQWAVVVPSIVDGEMVTTYKRISDADADEIISAENLQCVESDSTMKIWDTPSRDFQKKYGKRIIVTNL